MGKQISQPPSGCTGLISLSRALLHPRGALLRQSAMRPYYPHKLFALLSGLVLRPSNRPPHRRCLLPQPSSFGREPEWFLGK